MTTQIHQERFQIHDYDRFLDAILRRIRKELSSKNVELILQYDKVMVRESLAKPTRRKHLEVLPSLGRLQN